MKNLNVSKPLQQDVSLVKAIAPGKIILSGEHAVVHGQPALAMAINRYSEATIVPQADGSILFNASNLRYQDSMTLHALKKLKRRLQRNYERFLQGTYSIRDVLKKPVELSQYAITHFLENLNYHMQSGFKVNTQSTIPMGCGMGSSAAMILSVLYALGRVLQLDWDDLRYFEQGLEIENLQHGNSSGLDLQVSLKGGCMLFEDNQTIHRSVPKFPLYIVNTGRPLSTTGECVSHAKKQFSPAMLEDFGSVTRTLDQSLQENNIQSSCEAVQENHQLLIKLGVVPEKVRLFIQALELQSAAAKICGAGSVIGNKAGIVLIISPNNPTAICEQFGFSCMQIHGEKHGLHIL